MNDECVAQLSFDKKTSTDLEGIGCREYMHAAGRPAGFLETGGRELVTKVESWRGCEKLGNWGLLSSKRGLSEPNGVFNILMVAILNVDTHHGVS